MRRLLRKRARAEPPKNTSTKASFDWRITAVDLAGGDSIKLQPSSVVVLIGPNAVGKSTILRDIQLLLVGESYRARHMLQFEEDDAPRTVTKVHVEASGDADTIVAWLSSRYPSKALADGDLVWITKGATVPESKVRQLSKDRWQTPEELTPFLVHRLDTARRLTAGGYVDSVNVLSGEPREYIHELQQDDALASRISAEFRDAFGEDLIIDWGAGRSVGFRVGLDPAVNIDGNRVSTSHLKALHALPRLDDEGDGLRSFVSCLLAARCGAHDVLLVDEPEAFLHPPQAQRLGHILASSSKSGGRQVITATHSADVLRGALASGSELSVCRVTREGNANRASMLSARKLAQFWSRPLLRSSAAVEGLFHEGVIVCEGDADSRYYEAVLANIGARSADNRPADLYFVHGGGKGQLAALAEVYCSVKTKTAIIADLDLLRDEGNLRNVLSAIGLDLSDYRAKYHTVRSALASLPPVVSHGDLVAQARRLVDMWQDLPGLTAKERASMVKLLDDASNWSEAKRYGIGKLRGGAYADAEALLESWSAAGLFLVPVGELEGWWPEGPATKAEWIVDAFRMLETSPSQARASAQFIEKVLKWFGYSAPPESGAGVP